MKNTAKNTSEAIIPVGTGRNDVRVLLEVVSQTETVIYVMIAVSVKNSNKANDIAEEIKNQEILCLRKEGYEQVGESTESKKRIRKKLFIVTKYVFQWTDWKWKVMKMKKVKKD